MRRDLPTAPVARCMVVIGLAAAAARFAIAAEPSPEAIEFFETRIRPVLVENCYECHSAGAKVLQGGLRLDTAERAKAGGDSGPAIVPHQPDDSLLISALRYDLYEMPPSGRLPAEVIDDFVKWISLGAPDPRGEQAASESHEAEPPDPRSHWAFQRPERASPPALRNTSWTRSEVDRFVLARIEAAGLTPSPPAAPRALLRRLHYALTGLPPTAEELAEFEADPSDARYEQEVDRLLASPRFGERWARHWLDVARYADTKGYVFEEDRNYPHAYKYRDWVVDSFNEDLPFDRFVVAQIAADQLDDSAAAPAMGFLTLGRRFLNNKHDIINDRIDVVTRGLLGLTVACARCHDHKYDPISTAEYYGLYGVFASSQETPKEDGPPMLVETEKPVEPVVFIRGSPHSRGPQVERRFLSCLTEDPPPPKFEQGSGRREMAEAIASRDNPLTARVWVNRVWGHLFGRPLVATPSDFGMRGEPPTHPELLDFLAREFMDDGWSTKRLVLRLVLSSTYRQASDDRPDCAAVDPENRLLWRMNRRRLDLEALRDSLLLTAGRIDLTPGGPPVQLTTEPFPTRRSIYGFIERQNLPAFFRTFDFANPSTHTPERPQTVSPQQALFLLNSPFVLEQASHLAARSAEANGEGGEERRVAWLFRFALGREPEDDELADALALIGDAAAHETVSAAAEPLWQFGWGTYDDADGSVAFHPLGHFTGTAWQGGPTLPDPALGWVMLHAAGGHPGDAAHQAIRRWTAPAAGTLHIEGVLAHPANEGDGVRGRMVASRAGAIGAWEVRHGEATTAPPPLAVESGDTVDFITDCRGSVAHDSFNWTVTLRLESLAGEPDQMWDSVSGFRGPVITPLDRWERLAQVLLMSNEFAFVD